LPSHCHVLVGAYSCLPIRASVRRSQSSSFREHTVSCWLKRLRYRTQDSQRLRFPDICRAPHSINPTSGYAVSIRQCHDCSVPAELFGHPPVVAIAVLVTVSLHST